MNSNSWFIEIQAIMYKYNLGDALYWIENPMKKEQAMKVIKKEVSDYWSKYIQDMAILYQGLRYLDFNNYTPGKLHKLLTLKCKSGGDRHRIPIKLKMLTGSYILQSPRHKIFNEGTDSLCMACNSDDETLENMILHYKAWSKTREQILPAIARLLAEGENVIWSGLDDGDKMQILMVITKTYQSLKINIKTATEVEFHARRLLYRIHTERYRMLIAK
jgi:hypothetical protein